VLVTATPIINPTTLALHFYFAIYFIGHQPGFFYCRVKAHGSGHMIRRDFPRSGFLYLLQMALFHG
jgi:hypothetical protein